MNKLLLLTTFNNLTRLAPERQNHMDFKRLRGGSDISWMGPYANHLHHAPDRQLCQYLINFLQAECSSWCPINSVKAVLNTQEMQLAPLFNKSNNRTLVKMHR